MSRKLDATSWFGPILEKLRTEYGNDVHVGTAIDSEYLELLEKQLHVKFPADYRAFLASYGFLRVCDTLSDTMGYGVPMSTTHDADAVDLRRAFKDFARLVFVREEHHDFDFMDWYAKRGGVVPVIGEMGAFDDDTDGQVRGVVYAIDQRGKLWDLVKAVPERSDLEFSELVERLARRMEGRRRKPPEDEDLDDPTSYRRLIPISALLARSIEERHTFADDVALRRTTKERPPSGLLALPNGDSKPQYAANVVELRRHIPALLEVLHGTGEIAALAAGAPIARATCGDRDLRGPEMQTRMFTPSEVSELAAALANVVEDVRAAGAAKLEKLAAMRVDLDALIDLATRVRDAYQDASRAGYAMMVRYSRI